VPDPRCRTRGLVRSDPSRRRVRNGRKPEYLIIATNVRLTSVPGIGGKDRVGRLIAGYVERNGLKDWALWDGNQISTFLDAYPVRCHNPVRGPELAL
jgi:hypothetical protein